MIAGQGGFEWSPRDVFVVPSWLRHYHEADDDAVLFSFSDRPVQEKLGLWREQRGNERQRQERMSAAGLRVVPADGLAPVAAFAESLRHVSWFAAVGQELTGDERNEASDYLRAIDFPTPKSSRSPNGARPRPRRATRNGAARGGTPKSAPARNSSRAPVKSSA